MGGYCSRLPAPRLRESSQRLIEVRGAAFPGDLARQVHAGGRGGIRGHAGECAQLVGSESQDVVEAGISRRELECPVEVGPAAQHARGELVGEAAVAVVESCQILIARRREGGARAHRLEDPQRRAPGGGGVPNPADRKSTRLNSSHSQISYAVFCLKKKKKK